MRAVPVVFGNVERDLVTGGHQRGEPGRSFGSKPLQGLVKYGIVHGKGVPANHPASSGCRFACRFATMLPPMVYMDSIVIQEAGMESTSQTKIMGLGLITSLMMIALLLPVGANARPGDLEPEFGDNGLVTTLVTGTEDQSPSETVATSDGATLVV
ncbi:MAG: hypothetical protein ACSLFI_02435, partial [Solirubrobacterales bacterium]